MNNTVQPIIVSTDPLIFYYASDEPSTTPSLTANFVCRVLFGIISIIVCLVPLRLLHRHGEFSAVVLITTTVVKNLLTIVNALIWRNNNVEEWWPGYGFCDVVPYLQHFIVMLFITCMLAIMRNLAHQVGLMRANPLTAREKRRRNWIQALIMFPFPLLQVALTWFLTYQRYVIGALVGCSWTGSPNWIYVVFFIIPPFIAAFITTGYAVVTYFRFRQLAKTTGAALSSNRQAHDRARRTRRRLYFMIVSILVPFFPIVTTLMVLNILDLRKLQPYSYDAIHNHTQPYPWNTIIYLRSSQLGFAYLNIAWIPILSTISVFGFFGTTKDAINDYRRLLLFFGLGKIFPRLYQEYEPDRRVGGSSQGSSGFGSTISATGKPPHKVISLTSSFRMLSKNSSYNGTTTGHELQSMDRVVSSDVESGRASQAQPFQPVTNPADDVIQIPHRNPWLMRTHLNFPVIPFSSIFSRKSRTGHADDPSQVSLNNFTSHQHGQTSPPIRTRVWSDEEGTATKSHAHHSSEDTADDARSISSAQGVFVETHLVHESQPSDGQR